MLGRILYIFLATRSSDRTSFWVETYFGPMYESCASQRLQTSTESGGIIGAASVRSSAYEI